MKSIKILKIIIIMLKKFQLIFLLVWYKTKKCLEWKMMSLILYYQVFKINFLTLIIKFFKIAIVNLLMNLSILLNCLKIKKYFLF